MQDPEGNGSSAWPQGLSSASSSVPCRVTREDWASDAASNDSNTHICALPREVRLATDPVPAVPANRAVPTEPTQPEFQLVRIHKVLDHAERAAIT